MRQPPLRSLVSEPGLRRPSQADSEARSTQAAPSPERVAGARAKHRSYYRWLRLSRLTLAAFVAMGGIALIWLVPWFPEGLDTADYTPELSFTVYLLVGAFLFGMLALLLQERARRIREGLMVWASVYDEATGLHNKTYLYDRLALECERARRGGPAFSVIVLQVRVGSPGTSAKRKRTLSGAALQRIGQAIDGLTHPTDMVAVLNASELAVLAVRVDRESRRALLERLREAASAEAPAMISQPIPIDVKAGAATYGVDSTEASALVQAARTAATLAMHPRGKAA
jgi:GGDEF domain-containing protein